MAFSVPQHSGPLRLCVIALVWCLALKSGDAVAQEPYRVIGAADIDASSCSQLGPVGQLERTFWVMRRFDIGGPTQVAIGGVPSNVNVTLAPTTLTYPGAVVGQQITATVTLNAGVTIPDSVLEITASDAAGNNSTAAITLHGACPRHNKDFTIRGAFLSTHVGATFPVAGALVEIYRDVPYWSDELVGSTITAADGSFDVKLWASDTSTYYAKLRLNDVAGVYLHDWYTPDIKDYNSVNRGSNAGPLIDLGITEIVRDGGSGTPRSAVWQAGHWARQEFVDTFGTPAPIEDYEIVIENTISGFDWTLRSKTHWEEGTTVVKLEVQKPIALTDVGFHPYFSKFINYDGLFHEFGHALRHTADGDDQHFFDDVVKYNYAQIHTWCSQTNQGFAFNEGWAEFWAMDVGKDVVSWCSGIDLKDMSIEGAVMNDIYLLAQAIDRCQPSSVSQEERFRQERRNMFSILQLRTQLVHSDDDLRAQLHLRFPGCELPTVGIGVASSPHSGANLLAASKVAVPSLELLNRRAAFYNAYARRLRSELAAVQQVRNPESCVKTQCDQVAERLLKPIYLRAQIAYAELVSKQMSDMYSTQIALRGKPPEISKSQEEMATQRVAEFDREARKIVSNATTEAQQVLRTSRVKDPTGALKAKQSALAMASRRMALKTTNPLEAYSFFELPPAPNDDQPQGYRR